MPLLSPAIVDYGDNFQRDRLRALQAVDEMVERIVKRLDDKKILDNTYIIYTSDNGFHISQHRLTPGKNCGIEEDINIPLIIRGPTVSKGVITNKMSSHTDIAPTIMKLALGDAGLQGHNFDGKPISFDIKETGGSEVVNVEFWGTALLEGAMVDKNNLFKGNNTYKSLRIIGPGYNYYYSVWCTNEHELYNMDVSFLPTHALSPHSQYLGRSWTTHQHRRPISSLTHPTHSKLP